jgi:hypothetical protein
VRIGASSCGATEQGVRDICETTGAEQHHWALLLVAALTAVLAFGAAIGRSKPAAVGLVGAGVAVLVIALAIDRGSLGDTHNLEARYAQVKAETGGAYTLELIAGALAIGAGGLAIALDAGWLAGASVPRLRRRRLVAEDVDDEFFEEDAEDEREGRRARREEKRKPPASGDSE